MEELVFEVVASPIESMNCSIAFKYEQPWLLKNGWHLKPDSLIHLELINSK